MSVSDLPISSSVRRIAERLSVLELMDDTAPGPLPPFTQENQHWQKRGGRPRDAHFLDFYSDQGLHRAFRAYGVHDALVARGFAEYHFQITREDAFHHRLEILLTGASASDGPPIENQVMDLRIHLTTLKPTSFTVDTASSVRKKNQEGLRLPVMVVDWLTMQNPRIQFQEERPMLPGQRFPGTGMGRIVHSLLLIMAERLRRHAVIQMPEHYHLAHLYHRAGYRFAREEKEQELHALRHCLAKLPFALAAWAVERNLVLQKGDDEDRGIPYQYQPEEMVLPLSMEMKQALKPQKGFFESLLTKRSQPVFEVDFPQLRQSLFEKRVPGLDPQVVDPFLKSP